ncbi:helix-turn-helix domain-containing protein [Mesorhizobium muleiense]|uniref:helix-turn-helix domain-containing protein n=1 Tax=Mesorhizobium muleiense TaxID=1004279 RepID=UPI001F1E6F8F|nr:helix-turn-helix transcriptional regulator [Mesorhizobium muleiense]MCF6111969.1 helix-turn-helix domain-containing protein [Mesorhizobium muleiense]
MDLKIRAILRATEWNQQKAAEYFGVSQSTVNRWLSGSEPEGQRRDAINEAYAKFVGQDVASTTPISGADEIRKLLEQIDGLKPADVTALLSVIKGFQQANSAQSEQSQPRDRSEPATPRREPSPSQ